MKTETYVKALQEFYLPSYTEIPDVGLYLEQVVKYINSYFNDFEEMKITSSMVSNYVKSKLIPNPHKKTYSREQIASLFFIAIAKNVLSMDYIRICLNNKTSLSSEEEAYTFFVDRMLETVHTFGTNSSLPSVDLSNTQETALNNIAIAVSYKMYLERFFSLSIKKEDL